MRRPTVVGNWKMYTRSADAQVLATSIRNSVAKISGIEVILCPPAIWLSEILSIIKPGGRIKLGAQNMFYEQEGPFTGEISPLMIKDVAEYVIIGHSERREHFGETNMDVNEKVLAALSYGLTPIICVGERKKRNKPQEAAAELREALSHVPKEQYRNIIVAYEPVWAIGTGDNAEPDYVARILTQLREVVWRETTLLYGGSVNSKNIAQYAGRSEIDGVLVGGASLRASEFVKICHAWSEAKSFRHD